MAELEDPLASGPESYVRSSEGYESDRQAGGSDIETGPDLPGLSLLGDTMEDATDCRRSCCGLAGIPYVPWHPWFVRVVASQRIVPLAGAAAPLGPARAGDETPQQP